MYPVIVPFAIEGRERMARLAAGHVEEAMLLGARRDDQPLGGPEVGPLDPGHVGPAAGQRVGRHVQPAAQPGDARAERVPDPRRVGPAPRLPGQGCAIGRLPASIASTTASEQSLPRGIPRVEQVRRPTAHQRPGRCLQRVQVAEPELGIGRPAAGRERREDRLHGPQAKLPDHAVSDRVDRRPPAPILDVIAQGPPSGVAGDDLGGEHVEEQRPPAVQEQGAVVELQREQVARAWPCPARSAGRGSAWPAPPGRIRRRRS